MVQQERVVAHRGEQDRSIQCHRRRISRALHRGGPECQSKLARLGSTLIAAPEVPTLALRRLLASCLAASRQPPSDDELRALAAAARGRPAWIVECVARWDHPTYHRASGLQRTLLSSDVEMSLWSRSAPFTR